MSCRHTSEEASSFQQPGGRTPPFASPVCSMPGPFTLAPLSSCVPGRQSSEPSLKYEFKIIRCPIIWHAIGRRRICQASANIKLRGHHRGWSRVTGHQLWPLPSHSSICYFLHQSAVQQLGGQPPCPLRHWVSMAHPNCDLCRPLPATTSTRSSTGPGGGSRSRADLR